MQVTDAHSTEFEDVLALNQVAVPHVNSLEPGDIAWFARHADYFRVARIGGDLVGFLIGLGPGLDYAATLRSFVPVMTCEVNIRPPNESSMAYHVRHGFICVATQETEGGKKEVALMEKRL